MTMSELSVGTSTHEVFMR